MALYNISISIIPRPFGSSALFSFFATMPVPHMPAMTSMTTTTSMTAASTLVHRGKDDLTLHTLVSGQVRGHTPAGGR
jgi:hypothetical protein